MTLPPRWLQNLAGLSPNCARALSRANEAAERRAMNRVLADHDTRLRAEMERRGREPHVVLGTTKHGVPYRVTLRSLAGLHTWATASSGAGKSRWMGAVLEQIFWHGLRGAPTAVLCVDLKGELVDLLLRLVAQIASTLGSTTRENFLRRLLVVRPFRGRFAVPWQLLAPEPGVVPHVQAAAMGETLSATLLVGTGIRQTAALTSILALAITEGWSLLELRFALYDDTRIMAAAARSPLPDLKAYFLRRWRHEARVTVDGLSARLDALLAIDDLKAMLSGPGSIDLRQCFLPGRISLFDLSGAPMGSAGVERALGSLVIGRLGWAAFDATRPLQADAYLVFDEMQRALTPSVTETIERTATLGRSQRLACISLHQSVEQIPPELRAILATNLRARVVGRSGRRDAELAAEFLPVTSRVPKHREPWTPAPNHPDFMGEAEEIRFRVVGLANLPRQEFVLSERGTDFPPQYIRAPHFDPPPWEAIDPKIALAVERGCLGEPRGVLRERAHAVEERAAESLGDNNPMNGEATHPRGARREPPIPDLPDAMGPPRRRGRRGEVP